MSKASSVVASVTQQSRQRADTYHRTLIDEITRGWKTKTIKETLQYTLTQTFTYKITTRIYNIVKKNCVLTHCVNDNRLIPM